MGALIVSRYPRHLLGWLLAVASLLSVTLPQTRTPLGPRGRRPRIRVLGPCDRLGLSTSRLAGFRRADHGLPDLPHRSPGLSPMALGRLGHRRRPLPADAGQPDPHPGTSSSGSRRIHDLDRAAHDGVPPGRRRPDRVSRLPRDAPRKARDDERRQLLWITSSAVFLAIGVVVILVVPRISGEQGTWVAGLPLRLAQLAVPLCVAVAVLRHRLLEIDLIVNRALRGRARDREWPRPATSPWSWWWVRRWVGALAASGRPCSQPPSSRWPFSLCGGGWCGLAADGPSARRRRRTRRWRISAKSSESRPDPCGLAPAVAEAAAHAVNAARVVVFDQRGCRAGGYGRRGPPPTLEERFIRAFRYRSSRTASSWEASPWRWQAGRSLRSRDHRLLADLADQAGTGLPQRPASLRSSRPTWSSSVCTRTHSSSRAPG